MGDASTAKIKDVPLSCKHCGHDRFYHSYAKISAMVMPFFEVDFLDRSADVFKCENCGFLHWFHSVTIIYEPEVSLPEEPMPEDDVSTESECLACGKAMPAGIDTCPYCGWTYRKESSN